MFPANLQTKKKKKMENYKNNNDKNLIQTHF